MDETATTDKSPPPAPIPPARARPRSLIRSLGLPILGFALGVGLTLWALPRIERLWQAQPTPAVPAATTQQTLPMVASPGAARPAAIPDQMIDARVQQLEERLTRITVEAQGASANAARAEGLLVAFAARRALDSGAPLGYVEGQLRLRFGQAQPRAVATIINASRQPLTIIDLRAGLLDVSEGLTAAAERDWWSAMEQEAKALVTFRRSSTPSPRPQAALDRALRYIDAGRVSAALAEVDAMPGRTVAARWVQSARRYLDARRALDLIETAAILEPRQLRASDGASVQTTSPLAP